MEFGPDGMPIPEAAPSAAPGPRFTKDEMMGHLVQAHNAGDHALAKAIQVKIDEDYPEPGVLDKAASWIQRNKPSDAVDEFFGKNTKPGEGFAETMGRQGLKAASLLVPGGPALTAAKGAGLATRMLVGAASGASRAIPGAALMGAADAESLAPADLAKGAASGVMSGGAIGGALGGTMPVAGALWNAVKPSLATMAHKAGNIATRGYGNISARRILSKPAVDQAYETGVISKGSSIENIADKAEASVNELSKPYNAVTKGLGDAGVGVNANDVAARLKQVAKEAEKTSTKSELAALYRRRAKQLERIGTEHDPVDGIVPLDKFEKIKTGIGDEAKAAFAKPEGQASTTGQALQDLFTTLKNESEMAVQAQASKAPDLAAQWVPLKEKLHNALEIDTAATIGKAREYSRQFPLAGMIGGGLIGYHQGGGWTGALAGGLAYPVLKHRGPATAGSIMHSLSKTNVPQKVLSSRASALLRAWQDRNEEQDNAP